MTLIKTSVLNFIATAIKIISGIIINKAIAVYIGPSGLALIGQFQNFTQLVMTVAQGAINKGITKYTAEYAKEETKLSILFSTASKISMFSSVLVSVGVLIFYRYAASFILKDESYAYVFLIFGFTLILFVINGFLLSVINGLKEINTWVKINILQSVYSLFFTTFLIFCLGLNGALIALVTNQSVVLFIVIWMLRKHSIIKIKNFRSGFDSIEAKKLAGFAVMAVATAVTVPISHLLVRDYIGENLGWEAAGYWQAMWYISTMYLMVVTTTLSIYYLPRLSEIKDKIELRKELLLGYKVIMPIVILMSIAVFILKDFIIWFLFTEDFASMRSLFLWQLIGDVLKLAAWLLSYLMLAKAMTKRFVVTEVVFNCSFVFLSFFLVNEFGLIGMSYAFAFNYFLYLIMMVLATKKQWC